MTATTTRVLLVDDHPLFRQGVAALIRSAPQMELVGEAGSLDEVHQLVERMQVDVALVDLLISPVGGIDITRWLRESHRFCRVLGLSVVEEPCIVAEMLRAGAVGFALKNDHPNQILEAVRNTATGIRYLSPALSIEAIELELQVVPGASSLETHLTRREREIFDLLIQGYNNTEIGTRLFIARRTVETHRHRITKKLNAHSVPELQRLAARSRQ
jgi:DNA-binding NarL/FixJ family response regulator